MTKQYTYQFNGCDGTFDIITIANPDGKAIADLHYWHEPDTDEAARVEDSARLICEHLNQWFIGDEFTASDPVLSGLDGLRSHQNGDRHHEDGEE
jgi:predicted extracellular nuclease